MTPTRYAALLCLVAGCGGGGGGDGAGRSAATQSLWADSCMAWKGWHDRCAHPEDEADGEAYYQECLADDRWALVWRRAVAGFVRCFDELPCEASDDRCLAQVVEELEVDIDDPLLMSCQERAHECPDVIDDECSGLLLYIDEARAAIEGCLSSDCDTFARCLADPLGGQ